MTLWPFTLAELTAGLRRYLAEPTLQVRSLSERPLTGEGRVGRVRGLHVEYEVGRAVVGLECVVKEPQGATRAGLAGVGLREVGLYRSLVAHLPLATPALIAADASGDWLVLEAVEVEIAPQAWRAEDYGRGMTALAALHERFWNLADDLAAYNWLARPLTRDLEIHVYAAARAVEQMMRADWPPLITGSVRVLGVFGQIISQVEAVVEPLRAAPQTLLHGDFWPGNVALQADGEMVVFDWQLVGLGPGVLDVVTFLTTSRWHRPDLPAGDDDLIALYRREMAQRVGACWSDEEWARLWEHALMWRFTQEMFGWLTDTPHAAFEARAAQFEALWLRPVLAAAERRLRPAPQLSSGISTETAGPVLDL